MSTPERIALEVKKLKQEEKIIHEMSKAVIRTGVVVIALVLILKLL